MPAINEKPLRIAITMGDPGGVGPEIIARAVTEETWPATITVIGNKHVMKDAFQLTGKPLPDDLQVITPEPVSTIKDYLRGAPSREGGRAAFHFIEYAVKGALEGRFDAIVTAPISKEGLRLSGYPWPGHTEMLGELTGTDRFGMMLIGGPIRVMLVTTHIPLKSVPESLTKEMIKEKITLARDGGRLLGIDHPRIGVSGLNPHAGEAGLFGREEEKVIEPAVREAQEMGINVLGPIPPDVIFRKAYLGELDLVVAMYHDQGLIPLKMIAFDRGVNITVGLPIIRTSPDHGTAYDIAWKGIAEPSSMIEAVKTAISIARNRAERKN